MGEWWSEGVKVSGGVRESGGEWVNGGVREWR